HTRSDRDWSSDVCSSDLLGKELQIWRSRVEAHRSFTFENNIVYWEKGPMTPTSAENVTFWRNVYGPIAAEDFRAGKMKWDEWREIGRASCRERGEIGVSD